ncbi:MAG: DUF503 domain-containing protein [Acidobacteria bacterium]|nr:MAG: DUF503 domain-containing protein [Acidobacteriota bacterium]
MPVGVLTLDIQIPYAHSLKEKRAVLQKMRGRLRSRFNVAVAELDHQDVWQHATLGVVSISDSQPLLESVFRQVLAESEKILGYDVANHSLDFF